MQVRAAASTGGLPAEIAISEYDDWPRGRVVYEVIARRFVIYADRRLQQPMIISILPNAFGLFAAVVAVRENSHYR